MGERLDRAERLTPMPALGPFSPILPVPVTDEEAIQGRPEPRRLEYPVGGPLCPGCHPDRYDETGGVLPEYAHLREADGQARP